ncbi:TylF/MycF/NovP-related O-methyltransferase [Campylobacter volucris]|uniref:TylF/MycF/NovP-related O-methyltransferase n=1 Tax=Campylobacter volucris TaxID=1031542 RepID=UPI00189EF6AF|nr:TylF/MycF/NovP-related O-methyltransferase [Campylobacter volucris]MBF7068297.1 class I SAM-dependent methyltransferase [Campylobacter volucris]
MKNILIYGACVRGAQVLQYLILDYNIIGFVDSDCNKHGKTIVVLDKEYIIYNPEELKKLNFDYIFIATHAKEAVVKTLNQYGINKNRINSDYYNSMSIYQKSEFAYNIASLFKQKNIIGSCAELGVYKGDFARYINNVFKSEKFYLLDTFEGFNEKDCKIDINNNLSFSNASFFSDTSLEYVKSRMPYPKQCHFIKGRFPETSNQIPDNEKFCFVHIDVDLYQPIIDGCEFFYPKLVKGGILMIHDYFQPYFYKGPKKAVDEFALKHNIDFYPGGDGLGVFCVKN